jgi:hypothetical protein
VNADEAHSRTRWCLIPLYVISSYLYSVESRDHPSSMTLNSSMHSIRKRTAGQRSTSEDEGEGQLTLLTFENDKLIGSTDTG